MTSNVDEGPVSWPNDAPSVASLVDALLADSVESVVVIDHDANISYVNGAVERLLGYTSQSLVGSPVVAYLHDEDSSTAVTLFGQWLGYRVADVTHEVRIRHAAGTWITATVRATVLPSSPLGALALKLYPTGPHGDDREPSIRRRVAVGEFTNRMSEGLLASTDSATVVKRIERSLGDIAFLTGAHLVAVFLEGIPRRRCELLAGWQRSGPEPNLPIQLEPDEESLEALMSQHLVANALDDPDLAWLRRLTHPVGAASVLSAPFRTAGQRGAVVLMRLDEGQHWSKSDVRLVEGVAVLFGKALQAAQMEQLLALTYFHGPVGFSMRTLQGVFVDCNQQYLDLYGLQREEAADINLMELLRPSHRERVADSLAAIAREEVDRFENEVEVVRGDGARIWVRSRAVALHVPGWPDRLVVTSVEDITSERQQRDELVFAATHDPLTGVANRVFMRDRIDQTAELEGHLPTLFILDLDRFKLVNDSLGHVVGDRVIQVAVDRLTAQAEADDLVARLGGDEFAIAVWQITEAEAHRFAERLIRSFEQPLVVDQRAISQTISVGVAAGESAADSAELFVNADRALREAKVQGRDVHVTFDESLRGEVLKSLELERDLRSALSEGQLELYFQPEFDVESLKVVGAEALLRWHHPTRGLIPAREFIEIAEHSGMIDDIGRFALRNAALSFDKICQSLGRRGLGLRVNISAREFARPELPGLVRTLLAETGLEAGRLCLEMTEMTLMDAPEVALATLAALREIGVQVAIDDFGTGYSSLAYLKRFPVDVIKIDRTFIADVVTDSDSTTIVESIVSLGEALSLGLVAEGVENEQQLEIVRRLGIERAQGNLVSAALSPADFVAFVQQRAGAD